LCLFHCPIGIARPYGHANIQIFSITTPQVPHQLAQKKVNTMVKVVMVILVKIDFRKGHIYTIIYKYIYIIYYRILFFLSIFDFDHFDHDHHDHPAHRLTCKKKIEKKWEKIRRPQRNLLTFAPSNDERSMCTPGTQHFLSGRREIATCPARKN
jgi:hypothetical protein